MRVLEAWSQTFTKPYVNLCKTHCETTTARLMFSIFTQYSWCFVYIFINKMVDSFCCLYPYHWHEKTGRGVAAFIIGKPICIIIDIVGNQVAPWPEGLRKLPAAARNGAGQPNWFFSHIEMWQGFGIMDLLCQWLWFSRPLPTKNPFLTSDLTGLTGAFLDLQIPSSSWLPSLKSHKQSQLHGFTMSSLISSSRLEVEAQHQLLGQKRWLVLLTEIERNIAFYKNLFVHLLNCKQAVV